MRTSSTLTSPVWLTTACLITGLWGLVGCSSPDSDGNRPPVAEAGFDEEVPRQGGVAIITLDAAQSYDPEGGPITLLWSLESGPSEPDWTEAQRATAFTEAAVSELGLYVFVVEITDDAGAVATDRVNVTVVEGPPVDADRPDAGQPDAEIPDAAPDAALEDAELPDAALDEGLPDAEPENEAPTVSLIADAERVPVGSPVQLTAEVEDDGLPGDAVALSWRLVAAPEGADLDFDPPAGTDSLAINLPVVGRYTFEITADDGELSAQARRVVYASGPVVHVLDPDGRAIWPVTLQAGGGQLGTPIRWSGGGAAVAFAARAGVLYVATEPSQVSPGALVVLAPGQPPVRRALPEGAIISGLVAGPTGVWIVPSNLPRIWLSDPLAERPLRTLELPEAYPNGGSVVVEPGAAWRSSTFAEAAVLRLDPEALTFEGISLDPQGRCNPLGLVRAGEHLYVGCRNQGAVVRVGRDFSGVLDWDDSITVGAALGLRTEEIGWANDTLVVAHRERDYVTLIPGARWDLAPDDPERAPGAQRQVALGGQVLDLATRQGLVIALVEHRELGRAVASFEVDAPARVEITPLGQAGLTALAVDAAEDLSRVLDPL